MYELHTTVHATSHNANIKIRTSIGHTFPIYCTKFRFIITWRQIIKLIYHCPPAVIYKVVQIWPGLIVCKQAGISPGHIWTTLYLPMNYLKPYTYHMQQSTSAFSTTNHTAAHNFHRLHHNNKSQRRTKQLQL